MRPEQCRAARALLNWRLHDLAGRANVSSKTVSLFENGTRATHVAVVRVMRAELEAGGVVFINDDACGPGVALSLQEAAA